MTSPDSKSWLLGSGYKWRKHFASPEIIDDPNRGLSLVAQGPYEPPAFTVYACASPGYQFGELTYEIDRELRQVSAHTSEGRLRHRWISRDDRGHHVPPDDERAWDPVDIVRDKDCVYLLDQRYQSIYAHVSGRETLSILFRSPKQRSNWSRMVLDDAGSFVIFDSREKKGSALIYNRRGDFLGTRTVDWPPPAPIRCAWLKYKINRRQRDVRVYDTAEVSAAEPDGKLLRTWNARDASGSYVEPADPRAWDPIDVTGDSACTFLLDQQYQIVYAHQYPHKHLSVLCQSRKRGSRWSRLALDTSGYLMIFDPTESQPLLYDRMGQFRGTKSANWPSAPPAIAEFETNASGTETESKELPYPTEGAWLSESLDSSIYNCQWHCIRMPITLLPPGTEVEVKTFSYQRKEQAPLRPNDPRFVSAHRLIAPTQPAPSERTRKSVPEFLVQSNPGQYLSIAIHLRGDGFGTPIIEGLRVQYPRESYLEYLPPIYSANETMRSFLDRFLSIFQAEWDEFDRRIEESDAFFDADAVPAGVAMNYLASWIGLELEGTWNEKQNRQLLKAAPKIFKQRGTVKALRDYVGVYLANIAGLTVEEVEATSFPAIVEGFQERQYLMLSQEGGSTLGLAKQLWGPGVVRRLQLGSFSREGEVELVSTGDPERDLFHYFAHRFRVYAPAAWVRTAEHEQLLRRAIEAEMPAHAKYELCLVDAGLRVDIQSTVGLDTIVGDPPPFRLSCEVEKEAISLPLRNQLGAGAVLSDSGRGPTVLDRKARVGGWILN